MRRQLSDFLVENNLGVNAKSTLYLPRQVATAGYLENP